MRSTATWWGPSRPGSTRGLANSAGVPLIPIGVALTTTAAPSTPSRSVTSPTWPATAAHRAAATWSRAKTRSDAAPAPATAAATARAAPPAPSSATSAPARSSRSERCSDATKPSPSVEIPTTWPSSSDKQFTVSSTCASPTTRSAACATSALSGIVTDRPLIPSWRIVSTRDAPPPAPTSKRCERHARPISLKAACWSVGVKEWSIGRPAIPTISRVLTSPAPLRASHWPAAQRRWSRTLLSRSCPRP